jgi:hypothetical protein
MESSNHLEQVRLLGKDETRKAISVNMFSKAPTSENGLGVSAPMKTQGQAGRVLVAEQVGDEVCGEVGPERLLGGAKTEDRWLKALLSPAPKSQGEAGLAYQGQVGARATVVSDKVSAFNATEELLSCREWLRSIRGMVEAGLQRLDSLLKDVAVTGPGQGRLALGGASKPKLNPVPRGKKTFPSEFSATGLGLGPLDCGHSKRTKSTGVNQVAGLGLKAGPYGSSGTGRPLAAGSSKWASVGGRSGLLAGPTGCASFGEAGSSSSAGPARFEVASSSGLDGGRQLKGASFKAPSSSLSESSAPEGSRSKLGASSQAEGREFTSTGGVTGRAQLSPAKEAMKSCRSSPASSKRERKEAGFEPTQYRVYQRSGRRTPMPSKARETTRRPGQLSGQVASTEKLEVTLPVSPVRLSFDGVEVDSCDSGDGALSVGELGASLDSAVIVPESEVSGASSESGKSGSNPVEDEELNFNLEVGGIMGLTCDGQVGQLKEVMGKLVAEKKGRGLGGERGCQVFNEL